MSKIDFNKNDKQVYFNVVKGIMEEINDGEAFCNIILKVGHDNVRFVNLVMRRNIYEEIIKEYAIGDKVSCKFFVSSKKKHGKWYTTANMLSIEKDLEN